MTSPSPAVRSLAEKLKRGTVGPSGPRDTVPGSQFRWGIVTGAPSGVPPTVQVSVAAAATPVDVAFLRSCLPLAAGDQVLLAQLGNDLVVVDVVATTQAVLGPEQWRDTPPTNGAVANVSSATEVGRLITPKRSGVLFIVTTSVCAIQSGATGTQGFFVEPLVDGAAGTVASWTPQVIISNTGGENNQLQVTGWGWWTVDAGISYTTGVQYITGSGGSGGSFQQTQSVMQLVAAGV